MLRKIWWAFVALSMAGIGVMLAVGLGQVRANNADLASAWAEIGDLRETVDVANDRLEGEGAAPVAVPDVVTKVPAGVGERGATGAPGVDGLPGKPGTDGLDGPTGLTGPSTTGGIGATGAAGSLGPSGATGLAGLAGIDGRSGADGAAGLTGADGATGATGATGARGSPGTPGRGVTSVACADTSTSSYWLVTYSDDTTSASPGPCRINHRPEESP